MQFIELENKDAARFSWNVLPNSRLEATRTVIPIGCVYTPLKPITNLSVANYPPLNCKTPTCAAILNPYCRVDFMNKIWICPFCQARNHFPHQYADISAENRPAELLPTSTTIEYVLDSRPSEQPIIVFVVDTCILEEELASLKSTILQSLMLLPEQAMVGLITFGRNVHVHELSFEDCPKSYVFRGSKPVTPEHVSTMLGLRPQMPDREQKSLGATRFLMPASECEFQLTAILEELTKDCWPCKKEERPVRCTGTAINVATALLETTFKGRNARIMTFVGGPPTSGPGMVCTIDLKEVMRSHTDLQKGNAPHYKEAVKFYDSLATRACTNGHVIDLFCCSLDQVGLVEMKVLAEKTGGYVILDDTFTRGVFMSSFKRVFNREAAGNRDLTMAFSGELSVLTSRELQVAGAIGSVSSLDRKHACVAETETGIGSTCAWSLGGLDQGSSLSLFFEIANHSADALKDVPQCYIQIVTRYKRSNGRTHLRVSTIAKAFTDPKTEQGLSYVKAGFDQEAAAVLLARLSVFKSLTEYSYDVLRWLDRMLIRLVQKFATYTKDDAASFKLAPEFSYFPQFIFHLRRSQFVQTANTSPDESSFFRNVLIRENVVNSLVMIQPTLIAYSLDGPAAPVMLDVTSLSPTRILVLDTFFHIVIWYGDTIARWQADGMHLRPEYSYLAQLLAAPKQDVTPLMEARLPHPRFIECVQNGSQSRFLMAKVNPSVTHNSPEEGGGGEHAMISEDVNLKVFMQFLRRLAVQS